jgi:hypothetical protein
LPRPKLLHPAAGNPEQPKEFRFAVSWETLLAFPQPVEMAETVPSAVVVVPTPSPTAALQVVEPPPRRPQRDEAAWEMVVPKMVRK